MNYEFLYADRVDDDIDEALNYYASKNIALVRDFLNRIEEAKQTILNSPEGFEMKHKNIRTVLLKQFPYHIYYITEDYKIIILAILHAQSGQDKINDI